MYMQDSGLRDYTLANCKVMLGQAREKFASIAGPQGGTALNGPAMKARRIQHDIRKTYNGTRNYYGSRWSRL